jgi:hypothetical protein
MQSIAEYVRTGDVSEYSERTEDQLAPNLLELLVKNVSRSNPLSPEEIEVLF